MIGAILTIIGVIALLILINGIYVAAEFATVSSRRPRLAQMADEGNALAGYVLSITESPEGLDTYIAACQLGITISSLVLGFYGQSQILALVEPQLAQFSPATSVAIRSVSAVAVLLVLTVLQVILGELMPKNIGVQFPERLAIFTAPIMRWSVVVLHPLIWFFNGSGRLVLKLIGQKPSAEHTHLHSPEEIVLLVEESSAGGMLDAEERRLLVNTLQLRNLTARKVMIPRTHILATSVNETCADLLQLLARSPYSRLPVYEENIDAIVGIIHLKDLLQAFHAQHSPDQEVTVKSPRQLMHPVIHVPDSAPVEEVMDNMQRGHYNVAIVVDEYGGTAGMITFEDLVEEIIGEFQDEFDVENPPVELRPNNRLRVRGDVHLDDLNELLDTVLTEEDVDTIGGLVLATIGRIPRVGDIAQVGVYPIRVDRVANNSVLSVSFPVNADQVARIKSESAGW